MAKITMRAADAVETPTQTVVRAAASNTAAGIDKRGREIVVKSLNALDLYRLTKALKEHSNTQASLNLAMTAASVTAIDGEPVAAPTSDREIEAMLQRLDFDGLEAANKALTALAAPDLEAVVDSAKN